MNAAHNLASIGDPTGIDYLDNQRRENALASALTLNHNGSAAQVLGDAQRFYAFLSGEAEGVEAE